MNKYNIIYKKSEFYSKFIKFWIFCIIFSFVVRNKYSYEIIITGVVFSTFLILIDNRKIFYNNILFVILIIYAIISSSLSVLILDEYYPSQSLFLSKIIVVSPVLFLLACFFKPRDGYNIVEFSLYFSISVIVFIAFSEIVFNFDMIVLLGRAQESDVAWMVAADRLLATSIYINFNDLMFVLSIYFCLIVGRIYSNKSKNNYIYIAYCLILISYQFYVGSRASIMATMLAYFLFLIYKRSYKLISFLICLFFCICVFLFNYIYIVYSGIVGGSTGERLEIYTNSMAVIFSSPVKLLFGFGASGDFYEAVHNLCGYECLANPHNVLIEIIYTYGILIFLVYIIYYIFFIINFFSHRGNKEGVGLSLAFIVFPVSGLGPSSALDFSLHWWILIGSFYVVGMNSLRFQRVRSTKA